MRRIFLSVLALSSASLVAPISAASGNTILPAAGHAAVTASSTHRAMAAHHRGRPVNGRWYGGWGSGDTVDRDAPPPRLPYYDDGPYGDYGVTYDDDYDDSQYRGIWTGTWTGEDGRTYSGTYNGAFHSEPDMHGHPHWRDASPYGGPILPYQDSYYAGGYYYPAPTVTTIVIHPSVTTTTTTFVEEEVTYRRPAKKTVAPRRSVKTKLVKVKRN